MTMRTRNKTSLDESWIAAGWKAYASDDGLSAEAAVKAKVEAVSAKLKSSSAGSGGGDDGGGDAGSGSASSGKEKELRKKHENLKT